jgi:hypothetical protein
MILLNATATSIRQRTSDTEITSCGPALIPWFTDFLAFQAFMPILSQINPHHTFPAQLP